MKKIDLIKSIAYDSQLKSIAYDSQLSQKDIL